MEITAKHAAARKLGVMRPQLTAFQKETLKGAAERWASQAVMGGGGGGGGTPQHTIPCAARSLTDVPCSMQGSDPEGEADSYSPMSSKSRKLESQSRAQGAGPPPLGVIIFLCQILRLGAHLSAPLQALPGTPSLPHVSYLKPGPSLTTT